MITLLERRGVQVADGAKSGGWSRLAQTPSIQRDGVAYDANLARFLADLPLNGVGSQHSLHSYGYDLLVWVRFLDEARAKTVWQATRDDVDAYHRARRHDDAANRISASSSNRAVAALDKLYRWAVEDAEPVHLSRCLAPNAVGPRPHDHGDSQSGIRARCQALRREVHHHRGLPSFP
jgi:hypothetical protein